MDKAEILDEILKSSIPDKWADNGQNIATFTFNEVTVRVRFWWDDNKIGKVEILNWHTTARE